MSEKSEKSDKGETPERKKKSRKEKDDPEAAEEHKKRRAERAEKLRRAEAEVEERKHAAEAEALKQREAEVKAAASVPKLVDPEPEVDFSSLESVKLDGSLDSLELFPRSVYEAFAQLQRHARELNIALSTPEIVVIGPKGQGKSYLIEALLGKIFNGTVSLGSKRPLIIHAVNSFGKTPRCVIKRDGVIREFDRDVEVSNEAIPAEIAKRNETESSEPIVLQFESPDLITMSIVDTPGLILDPSDPNSKTHEQLVFRAISPQHRLIVVVRSSSDAAMPPTASDYVLDIVKQVDPEFTRTVIVYTHLNQQLQSFQSAKLVNRFLSGPVPDVRTFFITLPSCPLREKMNTEANAFKEKLLQAQRRDLNLLESLQFDKRFSSNVGAFAVLKYVHGFAWKAYQEAAPRVVKVLRQKKNETLKAITENANQSESLTPSFFRVVASDYTMEFLHTLERLIRGTAEGNPAVHGQTLEQEKSQCGVDAQWVDIRGIPIPVEPDEWEIPHWQNRLYGGQQFERLLAEFKAVSDHTEIPELTKDDIATAAGIPKLHNVPNFSWAACDLARQKSQESFEPLVNQLTERAVYVIKRLSDVAESMMNDGIASNRRRASSVLAANKTSSSSSSTTNASTAGGQQKKVDAANAETYPYFVHFVKDQFFKFVDETAKHCKELCSDEFYTTRTIFWDLTENEHVPTVERTEQVADLARSLFRRLRERITRNVLLKFYNHLLVPIETKLWQEMQKCVSELNDKALEDLFEAPTVRDALANSEIKLKGDLKDFEEREKVLLEVASAFSHPTTK